MSDNYSKRELDHFFDEIKSRIDSHSRVHMDGLSKIELQLKEMNSKVAKVKKWTERANGALIVIAFLGFSGIVSLAMWWVRLYT